MSIDGADAEPMIWNNPLAQKDRRPGVIPAGQCGQYYLLSSIRRYQALYL